MKFKIFTTRLFISFSALIGCADPSDSLPATTEINKELQFLREVLKESWDTPEGKLKSEMFFLGPNTLQFRTDFYYDLNGKEILKVSTKNEDTLAIYVNEYFGNGKLDQTRVYVRESDKIVFSYYLKRFYENNGLVIHVKKGINGKFFEHEQYTCDELGRKSSYRRGTQRNFALYRFIYENEQSTKVYEEHYFESEQNEPLFSYQ